MCVCVHAFFSFLSDLQIMGDRKEIKLTDCLQHCQSLSPRGSYGLVTPIFKEQYLGIRDSLNFTKHDPIWLGLKYNGDIAWNRYSPNQTVQTFLRIHTRQVPSEFELPVFYHKNTLVVDQARGKGQCVCEKGEHLMQNCW